jgi:hypothetical protein
MVSEAGAGYGRRYRYRLCQGGDHRDHRHECDEHVEQVCVQAAGLQPLGRRHASYSER